MDLEDSGVELIESPPIAIPTATPTVANASPDIEMCPPQRRPGELVFIVNAIDMSRMPPAGSIRFAPPMGIEDWANRK
jgi:hypothetical protein